MTRDSRVHAVHGPGVARPIIDNLGASTSDTFVTARCDPPCSG